MHCLERETVSERQTDRDEIETEGQRLTDNRKNASKNIC